MLNASITVEDPKGIISRSFVPEDKNVKGKATYNVIHKNDKTTFIISADDSVSLRTIMNSITKMLTVIEKMKNVK